MSPFSVGTHNLHDLAGIPTAFADLIGFTEAIPKAVKSKLLGRGYKVLTCWQQRDLVLAYDAKVFKKVWTTRYKRVVNGRRRVTPNRGTWRIRLRVIATGELVDVFLEHRINAGFPPYVRGEATFRRQAWQRHTSVTLKWIHRSISKGRKVIAFGDLNTPHGVKGYRSVLGEVGSHFDRIGAHGFRLDSVLYMDRAGSDHLRLRCIAYPKLEQQRWAPA